VVVLVHAVTLSARSWHRHVRSSPLPLPSEKTGENNGQERGREHEMELE
jgi:hypothetical protein